MSDFCIDGDNDSNTMCINDFDYEKSTIIKPFANKSDKVSQKFIFIDSDDYTVTNGSFTVKFDETIKDVLEIELMSCQLPKDENITSPTADDITYDYPSNYILLHVDNLDLRNYKKISANQNVTNCFARLPIAGRATNVFFGRIKNFTNVYECKPVLQKLNKLVIRISAKDGSELTDFFGAKRSVQLTIGITFKSEPDLFDN
tara:strand:+ start:24 stop:629 length:606 start_codon:yes stop_codon:yes gene_type:complete